MVAFKGFFGIRGALMYQRSVQEQGSRKITKKVRTNSSGYFGRNYNTVTKGVNKVCRSRKSPIYIIIIVYWLVPMLV